MKQTLLYDRIVPAPVHMPVQAAPIDRTSAGGAFDLGGGVEASFITLPWRPDPIGGCPPGCQPAPGMPIVWA